MWQTFYLFIKLVSYGCFTQFKNRHTMTNQFICVVQTPTTAFYVIIKSTKKIARQMT